MISHTGADSTIPRMLRASALRHGASEAVVDGTVRLSFAELYREVLNCAGAMLASGVGAGDRVAIWAPNSCRWMITALGVVTCGAVLVPINTRYKGEEAGYLLEKTRARLLVCDDGFLGNRYVDQLRARERAEAGGEIGAGAPVPSLPHLGEIVNLSTTGPERVTSYEEFLERGRRTPPEEVLGALEAVRPEDVCDIVFTSGTTGRPKGVVLAHGQTLREYDCWSEVVGLGAGDRYLIVNPFFHLFGYKAGIIASVIRGVTIVVQPVYEPATTMRLVEDERISVLTGPPTLYATLLDHPERGRHDLSSLRVAVTGAAMVPVVLIERMRSELSFEIVLTAYGLTESGGTATMCRRADDDETIATTSGRAIDGMEVRIVGPDGEELPAGRTGEIVVRGYGVMSGYLEDPEATAEALDREGWLHTGDVGVLDERGYLRITDRLKDMFIVGGFNAYPAEIEQTLLRHPQVGEAAVVGVPDPVMGEVGRAFVVPRPGGREGAPSPEELIAYCRGLLANFKVPRSVVIVDVLPRNAGGKVMKDVLRAGG